MKKVAIGDFQSIRVSATAWFIGAVFACTSLSAQVSTSPARASPVRSEFQAHKWVSDAKGVARLPPDGLRLGDFIEYTARHTNVSKRALQRFEPAIAIPAGTALVQGSIEPADGVYRDDGGKPRVVWRIAKLDSGATVQLRLRVRVEQ
jgi:hypothetical protein